LTRNERDSMESRELMDDPSFTFMTVRVEIFSPGHQGELEKQDYTGSLERELHAGRLMNRDMTSDGCIARDAESEKVPSAPFISSEVG